MPWDGTQLFVVEWGEGGAAGSPRRVAGGPRESIFQPSFSPAGRLTFVSDRTGWWNLYQLREGGAAALCPLEAEFGRPQWVFAQSTYDFIDEATILCVRRAGGRDSLARLDLESGALDDLALPYTCFHGVGVEAGRACFLGASPTRAFAVCELDLAGGSARELRSSLDLDPGFVSVPQAIEIPTQEDAVAHAFFYEPLNPGVRPRRGERPPLITMSHGGPTTNTMDALDLRVQYWTSRGFAVADVDYRGSTGYGRAYRGLLRGAWGVADVADCIAAARFVTDPGPADRERAAIAGGSAGGYTTLCALVFHDFFRAGASHYGVADLEALARETHKFEARYLDGLIGPYPERKDLYMERSPIHFTERLSCPVIFFQGLEDLVVPPAQAEAMVAALAARGIPHAYVAFPGEQHGFRRAESICTALDGELFFYSRVFGFEVDVHPEGVRIVGELV